MKHPLFTSPNLAQAWDWADGPNPEEKLRSLLLLADNRHHLPGAVFFTVPDGEAADAKWQELVGKSVPYCNCKSRRVLWPTKGRSRLLLRTPPKTVEITLSRTRPPKSYMDAPPMVVMPHGGDLASAYSIWSFSGGDVAARHLPFMRCGRRNERLIFNQAGVGHHMGVHPDQWYADFGYVDDYLDRFGELTFMYAAPDPHNRAGYYSWLPTCSLVKADFVGPEQQPRISFEVDASVRVTTVDDDLLAPLHECANDIDN